MVINKHFIYNFLPCEGTELLNKHIGPVRLSRKISNVKNYWVFGQLRTIIFFAHRVL